MQDPEHYIAELGLTFPCPVRPDLDAVIDAEHRAFVNHEIYFFSSREAAAEFSRRPLRYAGLVTDPVNGSRFAPSEISPLPCDDGLSRCTRGHTAELGPAVRSCKNSWSTVR